MLSGAVAPRTEPTNHTTTLPIQCTVISIVIATVGVDHLVLRHLSCILRRPPGNALPKHRVVGVASCTPELRSPTAPRVSRQKALPGSFFSISVGSAHLARFVSLFLYLCSYKNPCGNLFHCKSPDSISTPIFEVCTITTKSFMRINTNSY